MNTPKRNFQKELEKELEKLEKERPKLLLHGCCAPCSSYVLEYLSQYFEITLFYYNPNITEEAEYRKRVEEVKRLVGQMELSCKVEVMEGRYEPSEFFELARGLEAEKEGGKRCYLCYELRIRKTAFTAAKYGYQYFTTTLSISPHKNAVWINEIGERMAAEYKLKFLPSDFKKKNGFKRSIALSEQYGLYRQNYCGCIYSRRQ